jgi:hypothetical protein
LESKIRIVVEDCHALNLPISFEKSSLDEELVVEYDEVGNAREDAKVIYLTI